MCGAIWECIKCPGRVVCCCCECALGMIMSALCGVIVLAVIIGLIVYFTVYYHKEDSNEADHQKLVMDMVTSVPLTFKDYFQKH